MQTSTPTFDYNTGQALGAGQSQSNFNTQTGQQIGNTTGTAIPQTDLNSFRTANPTQNFGSQDLTQYNGAVKPPTITADSLSSATPLSVPNVPTNNVGHDIATSVGSSIDQQVAQAKAQQDAVTKASDLGSAAQNSSMMDYVKGLFGQKSDVLGGQAAYEQQQGLGDQQSALNDIRTKIANETLGYRGALNSIRTGFQTVAQAQAAHNAVGNDYGYSLANLAIQEQAATANIKGIQDASDRRTQLLMAPIDNQIAYVKDFVVKNIDNLSAKEQAKAKALTDNLTVQKQDLKDVETARANMIAEVAKNGGGSDQATIQAIQKATSLADIATAGSKYVGKMDFLKSQADIRKLNSETNKNNGVGTGTGGSYISTSPVNVVNTPNGVQAVSTYTLTQGDDPYTIAQNNGTDMATLKSLNPNVTDWTKLPVGATIKLPDTTLTWLNGKTPGQVQSYNSLSPSEKGIVQQLVTGDALLTDVVKSRGIASQKQIEDLITKAKAIDPNFSINNNKIKFAANQKWSDPNGKSFVTRSAVNTALSHMATTYDAAQALGNTSIPKYNDIANWISANKGNPALTNFIYDLSALSSEIATAYKGGTPAEADIERVYNSMSGGMSPEQFKGVFGQAAQLMAGKLRSTAQEYKQVIGKYPTDPIVQPSALSDLKSAGVDTGSIDKILSDQGYSAPQAQNNQSLRILTPAEIPNGYYQASNGLLYKK